MSLKSSNKIETNVYEIEVTVDAQTFSDAVTKAFQRQRKSIAVPGFRKGKATQGMIERYYGEGVFFENALDIIYPDAVEGAVKEAGLKLVDAPYDVEIPTMSKTEGVELKFKALVAPEVKLGDYKKLSAVKNDVAVTDDEVAAELASVQDRNSRLIVVTDRPAAEGDTADINFEGFVDGVAFEGGKGENYPLVLGSGSFIPGFEDQVIGRSTGEEFDVNVTFPTEYDPSLADKDAVFKVKINELKTKELPELDDEFAKDVSEFDTLEEYKADLKKNIEEKKQKDAELDFENSVLDALVEVMEAEIPQVMFDKKTDEKINELSQRLQMQGLTLDMYVQYMGGDMEAFRSSFAVQAEREVKIDLALEAVAKAEKFEASEEEIDARVAEYAKQYSMEADAIRKALPAATIAEEVVIRKAIDFVKENAAVKKTAAKKPAVKKTAAKKTAAKKTTAKKTDAAEKAPAKKASAKKTKATDAE